MRVYRPPINKFVDCAQCSTEFKKPHASSKYCSQTCAKRAYHARRRAERGVEASPRRSYIWFEHRAKSLEKQKGLCAICKETIKGKPHLDHDHVTGAMRGVLCVKCNAGIGFFKDDPALLRSALRYLKKHAPANSNDGVDA